MIFLDIITHIHPIWENVFFYLFSCALFVFTTLFIMLYKAFKKKGSDQKQLQHQHLARVDMIRKEHTNKLESLRIEMLKREEDRTRQWIESEKETLHVLNGVSNLLELSDKVDKVEFKKINNVLADIEEKIVSEKKLIAELQVSEHKYRQLFENSIVAISVHDVILDEKGKPCNYRFTDVNRTFEEITGLKAIDIVGKTVLDVIPDVEDYWINMFGNVGVTGNPITFENFNKSTGKNYRVTAYAPETNKFIALSIEVSPK